MLRSMNMDEGTKQWAIFMYAMLKHGNNRLKEFTSGLFEKALDPAIERGQGDISEEPITITVDQEAVNGILAIIYSDHKADMILDKMIEQEAFKLESEEELQAKFKEVADNVSPTALAEWMTEHRSAVAAAAKAAKPPEATGPSASDNPEDLP